PVRVGEGGAAEQQRGDDGSLQGTPPGPTARAGASRGAGQTAPAGEGDGRRPARERAGDIATRDLGRGGRRAALRGRGGEDRRGGRRPIPHLARRAGRGRVVPAGVEVARG